MTNLTLLTTVYMWLLHSIIRIVLFNTKTLLSLIEIVLLTRCIRERKAMLQSDFFPVFQVICFQLKYYFIYNIHSQEKECRHILQLLAI